MAQYKIWNISLSKYILIKSVTDESRNVDGVLFCLRPRIGSIGYVLINNLFASSDSYVIDK